MHEASKVHKLDLVGLGFLCGYLASRLKSPVRVRVNLDWNEEATSVNQSYQAGAQLLLRSRIAASSRCALASSARGAEASPSWSGSAAE